MDPIPSQTGPIGKHEEGCFEQLEGEEGRGGGIGSVSSGHSRTSCCMWETRCAAQSVLRRLLAARLLAGCWLRGVWARADCSCSAESPINVVELGHGRLSMLAASAGYPTRGHSGEEMLPCQPLGGAFMRPIFKLGGGKPGSLGVGMVGFLGGYLDEGADPGGAFQGFGGG